jgi:hypothetical protein
MSLLFFWFVFAIIVGVAASKRGRNGGGWFILSLFVSPLLSGLLLLVLPRLNAQFQADGAVGQIPFRKLPGGGIEAVLQGQTVRFPNMEALQAVAGPEAKLNVINGRPAPKPGLLQNDANDLRAIRNAVLGPDFKLDRQVRWVLVAIGLALALLLFGSTIF